MIYFLINGYEVMLFASIEPRLFSSEEKLANPTFQNDTIFFISGLVTRKILTPIVGTENSPSFQQIS